MYIYPLQVFRIYALATRIIAETNQDKKKHTSKNEDKNKVKRTKSGA